MLANPCLPWSVEYSANVKQASKPGAKFNLFYRNRRNMKNKAKFNLSLFGGFHLVDSEGQPVDPGPRKLKALLGWLAVNPNIEHPREKLAAMFWPDSEEGVARHSLRQALASLRKVMPENVSPIHSFKDTILLDSSKIEVDALKFEAALSKGEVRVSEEITRLYKGEFLSGCNPRTDLFEGWLSEQRHHYRERAVNAMCQWLTALIDRRKFKPAVPVAVKLINIDPLRESAYRGLMMAHMGLGNHALALRWYRRCEHVLMGELKVLPCLETRALHAQLLSTWNTVDSDIRPVTTDLDRKKKARGMVSKAGQRALYQAEAALEGVIDRIGGQSILLRSESADAKSALVDQIVALTGLHGFQVCRAVISPDGEQNQGQTPGKTATCSPISNCLTLGAMPVLSTAKDTEYETDGCLTALKTASEASPVLLLVEDIHAAGQRTLELLARLITMVGEASVLLLMTTGYGGKNRESAWQGAMLNAPLTTIDLA